jgi:hypothetical protein
MPEPQSPTAKILFRVPNEDGSAEVETLWAFDLGGDRYEIANCPFFAYGVSYGEVVSAPVDPQEEMPTFQKVLSKSGNRDLTVQRLSPDSKRSPMICSIAAVYASLHGTSASR